MGAAEISWGRAAPLAAVAMVAAAAVNGALYLLAGDVVRVPGELTVWHAVGFTLGAFPFVAGVLRLVPAGRQVLVIVALAVLTLPFPYMEFAASTATWLAAMHGVAALAAILASRQVTA